MMPVIIEESGMKFGPFEKENIFYIEKSAIYKKLESDLRMAEFLLYRPEKNALLVLEAKTSAPNPNPGSDEDEQKVKDRNIRFEEYITEIHEKLLNGLTLGVNIFLDRHSNIENELPKNIKELKLNNVEIKLVLVIKKLEKRWLKDIQDKLQQKLRAATKTWNCVVIVINEEYAKKYSLIQ